MRVQARAENDGLIPRRRVSAVSRDAAKRVVLVQLFKQPPRHSQDTVTRSRRACARVCPEQPPSENQRAQGMPGAQRAPAASRADGKRHASVVTTVTPVHPAFPARMVLTVSFVLSPETGLSCLRRRRNIIRRLDASVGASGPHDFAVRKARALVRNAACVHRIPPHVRDDRETPLCWAGTIWLYCCFYRTGKGKFFAVGAGRETGDLPVGQVTKSPAAHPVRKDHRKPLDSIYPTS
jgi:hypothetical protein